MYNGAKICRDVAGRFSEGSEHLVKHGRSNTPIYNLYRAMRSRCENPNSDAYADYGGRGITVCERWLSFENFYSDMGDRPDGFSIDRIDNSKGYSPDNCRWADRKTQARNKRGLRMITAFGKTMPMCEWSDKSGIKLSTIWARLKKGMPPEEAVSKPLVKTRWK